MYLENFLIYPIYVNILFIWSLFIAYYLSFWHNFSECIKRALETIFFCISLVLRVSTLTDPMIMTRGALCQDMEWEWALNCGEICLEQGTTLANEIISVDALLWILALYG